MEKMAAGVLVAQASSLRKYAGWKPALPYILFLVCLVTRLVFFGRYIDDWDGVNFVFALSKGYDVLNDQPHFQGYPVYIFVSWIIYNIWHSDIHALILAGIIFSSLAILPLYALAYRMFSRQVATLAAVLYIVNPQVWLQAEKTLSDAFGLFFVAMFSYFFYRAIEPYSGLGSGVSDRWIKNQCSGVSNLQPQISDHQSSIINPQSTTNLQSAIRPVFLFLGSLTLGIGIGVRISYMVFVVIWGFIVFMACKRISVRSGLLCGPGGFALGIIVWLGYLAWHFGPIEYLSKFTSHSRYHFTEEGFSVLASTDYMGRLATIFKNIFAHSLGTWWTDTPLIRLLPTVVMAIAIVSYIISERMDLKNRFLVSSIGVYIVWLIVIQKAVRHTIVLIPFALILISAGVFHFVKLLRQRESRKVAAGLSPALFVTLFLLIAPMAFDSGRLVWINREIEPPQVALIRYIAKNYDRDMTKFFCLNTWRLFQYYAPEWHDKENRHVYFTSTISKVEQDIKNRYPKPKNVLVSSVLYGRDKYKGKLHKVKVFERDNYAVAEYNRLALYEFDVQGKDGVRREN